MQGKKFFEEQTDDKPSPADDEPFSNKVEQDGQLDESEFVAVKTELDSYDDTRYDPDFDPTAEEAAEPKPKRPRRTKKKPSYVPPTDFDTDISVGICVKGKPQKQQNKDKYNMVQASVGVVEEETADSGDCKSYKCVHCQKSFSKLLPLALHIKMLHSSSSRKDSQENSCPGCRIIFSSMLQLQNHIKSDHEGKGEANVNFDLKAGQVLCDLPGCKYQTNRVSNMTNHKRRSHMPENASPIKCEVEGCSYQTGKIMNFKAHLRYAHKPKQFQCQECGKSFFCNSNLQQHIQSAHSATKDKVCERCGAKFYAELSLKQHQINSKSCAILARTDFNFVCSRCPEMPPYDTLKKWTNHLKQAHQEFPRDTVQELGAEIYECDKCDEVSISYTSMRAHKDKVHLGKVTKKKYPKPKEPCIHCGKMVYKGKTMFEHVKSKHENDTPFKCDQCPRAYATESYLRQHINSVHRKLKCHVCGKEVCNKLWFKRHLAKDHGIIEEGRVKCDFCPIVFDTDEAKTRHMMKHHA